MCVLGGEVCSLTVNFMSEDDGGRFLAELIIWVENTVSQGWSQPIITPMRDLFCMNLPKSALYAGE